MAEHLPQAQWTQRADLAALVEAIGPGDIRWVGGAVRDGLLGLPVNDLDIATSLMPQDVVDRLKAAGIKAVPTGIEHGTVTAVANGKPFEITTLRRDVETDGRHATVAFTDDWLSDAARRDFTFNAMFCDADGTLYDPFDGAADLAAARRSILGSLEIAPGYPAAQELLLVIIGSEETS